jgi:hypothetical protein
MTPRRMRRRDFLGTLGKSAALSPFLPYLNRRAEADGGFPRRLMLIFTGNGTLENEFYPTGTEESFTFKPGSISEPLAPYRSHLIFPRNLRRLTSGSGAHEKNMGGLWTCCGLVATNGYPRGPSIDHVIAQGLNAGTPFKNLPFGVQSDSFNPGGNKPVLKSMTYSGSNAVVRPEDNPTVMFNKLMLGAGGGPTLSAEELQRTRTRRQSVLDAVRGDLRSLSTRLGRDDRAKLDQHLDGIAGLEKRLIQPIGEAPAAGGGACRAPQMMGSFADPAALALNENFPQVLDVQNRLAVAALACDRTRVATVQWSRSFSPIRHQWVGVREDHHTISHRTGATDIRMLHNINRWYGERFAELVGMLASVKEGEGTLLDNTLVVWGNEAATGNHASSPGITLMAGRCGGKIRTGANGRLLDLQGYDWSQLLITFAHAMGVPSLTKFGDLGMKDGDIPTLLG